MVEETFALEASARDDMGKGASRRLRRSGQVPGIIYGAGKDPVSISIPHHELIKHTEHEAFFAHILKLKIDGGGAENVVVKDLQRHPAKPFIQHIDLMRVRMDEEIVMHVPVHFEGEEECVGVKQGGGTVLHGTNELEISCLPGDLPESITVDVSELDVGDSIHLSQVELPKGVKLVGFETFEDDNNPMVASVEVMRAAPEPEEEVAEGEEAAPEAEEEGGED